jgi:ribosome biogenesis GTP-binding protein YsxC/EngB
MAIKACKLLAELGPMIRLAGLTAEDLTMPWARIILGAAQCESGRRDGSIKVSDENIELPVNLVYAVLNAMTTFPSDNDDKTYENLSNALVRRTCFITGATSMSRCPEADRGEVIFIGRSNVGKSSLVNMVTNRKSLAFTSKRPGKTQQFNYFAINDKPGKEKEVRYGDIVAGDKDPDSFYILDVPGFGYAKVPEKQRQAWSDFLAEYVTSRKTLRVIFHLIDGRHGAIDEDIKIMAQMGEIKPSKVQYVVVLTKADKNVKSASTKNAGKVSKGVLENVRSALQSANLGDTPVLLTSSETKLGRDDIWRYMSLAASMDSKKA